MDKLDLNSFFGDQDIDVECPNCNHEFGVNFKIITVEGSSVQCPNCDTEIVFNHDETTKKTLKDTQKAIKDFEKTLKKFGD